MKKKVIGLSILLLVLLLGLCSTSYANIQDDLTYVEFKNIIYNYLSNFGNNNLTNTDYVFTNYEDKMQAIYNSNPQFWSIGISDENGQNYGWVVVSAISNVSKPRAYVYGNYIYVYKEPGSTSRTTAYNFRSNASWYYQENLDNEYKNITNFSSNFDLYNNSSLQSVVKSAGISPSNATQGPFISQWVAPDYEFIPYSWGYYYMYNASGNLITDYGEPRKYYNIHKTWGTNIYMGQLINSIQTKFVDVTVYAYDKQKKDFWYLKHYNPYNMKRDTAYINSFYPTTQSGDFWISDIYISNDYIMEDTVLEIDFQTSGEILTYDFYVSSDNTRYSNGAIDPNSTFSGDYYNDYINNINDSILEDNLNNIDNTLTDDSEIDGMLAEFTSGDFASNIGFVERENPFQTFILQFVYEICDVLLASGDVYFDYSMHGETPHRIYASSFTTPETPLKAFLRLAMIFGALYILYNQFRQVVELINTGNAASVLQTEDADMYFYKM